MSGMGAVVGAAFRTVTVGTSSRRYPPPLQTGAAKAPGPAARSVSGRPGSNTKREQVVETAPGA